MSVYLLVQSKSPWEAPDRCVFALARELADARHDVTVWLVQNGVLAARAAAEDHGLDALVAGRVRVLVDDLSLQERGISPNDLRVRVREDVASSIDTVVGLLAAGAKAIWS